MERLISKDLQYQGETQLGEKYHYVVMAYTSVKEKYYRILFDQFGNPLTDQELVKSISKLYELPFSPGTIDDQLCFINTETHHESRSIQSAIYKKEATFY